MLDRWPCKTIKHLFYATSSFVHQFIAINEFEMKWQSGNALFGSKSMFFIRCDIKIWRMTLKNNRAPFLCYFKFCASFHNHWWNRTGVTYRKRQIWLKIDDFLAAWPWYLTDDLEKQTTSSFVQHFITIFELKLKSQLETAKFGFDLCDLDL